MLAPRKPKISRGDARPPSDMTHRIIWHELHTPDIDAAKADYGDLMGWRFQTEQAADFAWGDGPGAYHLIEAGGAIHGGMAALEDGDAHWLAYVRVDDVEAALAKAQALGATVARPAFETPGVGVNAVIADPGGARIGLSAPSYSFPPPAGVFLRDHLLTDDLGAAASFYRDLFGWTLPATGALGASRPEAVDGPALWVPVLAAPDGGLARAARLVAARADRVRARLDGYVLLADARGAVFGLETPASSS